MLKRVLTISDSDSSGGAGIQADIKTITAHKMYAMSAVTALTVQNTTGVYGIYETAPAVVAQQLDCIFADIRPDAIKIGMVSNADIINVIADKLQFYKADNVVIDTDMVTSRGDKLPADSMIEALVTYLFPLGTVITPNIPEAEALSGIEILSGRNAVSQQNILLAAKAISQKVKCAILIKGGHLECTADDLLYYNEAARWFTAERLNKPYTHGIGCTLSSAIACNLAAGLTLPESVKNAKTYVTGALDAGLKLGNGQGALDHTWNMMPKLQ